MVDVGANIGVYSQFLAERVGPTGMVHSFEPSPVNFARLRQSLAGAANVKLNQAAVGDTTGTSLLYLSDELNVDHRTYPTADGPRRTLLIQTTTLDDYFRSGSRVDLIKLDIQGFELHALRGARRVLAENPAIKLLFEFWPYGLTRAGGSAEQLTTLLQANEFHLFTFEKGKLRACNALRGEPNDIMDYEEIFATRVSEPST